MAWQELSGGSVIDIKKTINEERTGTYIGKKDIVTKIGPQIIWNFSSEEGPFGIYGFTNLNIIMEGVPLGTALKIVYKGTNKVQTKYGLKDVHQVQVQQWHDDDKPVVQEPKTFDDVPF